MASHQQHHHHSQLFTIHSSSKPQTGPSQHLIEILLHIYVSQLNSFIFAIPMKKNYQICPYLQTCVLDDGKNCRNRLNKLLSDKPQQQKKYIARFKLNVTWRKAMLGHGNMLGPKWQRFCTVWDFSNITYITYYITDFYVFILLSVGVSFDYWLCCALMCKVCRQLRASKRSTFTYWLFWRKVDL